MRVAIYARKSSESEDRQVQSLDDQLSILIDIAKSEGYTIVEVLKEAKSAKDPGQRPEFAKLVRLIEANRIDGVLTWHINRLTRNMVDGGKIAHLLHAGHIRFIRTPDKTFKPEDNVLILAIENATATNFIHDLTRNVARGMNSKADKGWFPGRAPLGYRNNLLTNTIEPDPERFHLIRQGWDLLLAGGMSLAEVYRHLVDSGLTMYGRGNIRRPLRQKSAYDIFSNIFYVGQFQFRGQTYQGAHRPMITPEEYSQAKLLLSRDTPRSLRRIHSPAYSGLFVCAKCGSQVVADIKTKRLQSTGNAVQYTYYRCSGARGCDKRGLREEVVTARVIDALDRIKISTSQAQWCRKVLGECFERHALDSTAAVSEAQSALNQVDQRLNRLTMLYVDGNIGREEHGRTRLRLESELAEARQRLERLTRRDTQALAWIDRQINAAMKSSLFENGDTYLRRTVLATLGSVPKLCSEWIELNYHPVLEKIGVIEPAKDGSDKRKTPPFSESILLWGDWSESIRTMALAHADALINQSRVNHDIPTSQDAVLECLPRF